MFEVQDLRYATLATVSRCGMVWFSEDVLSTDMIFENYIQTLRNVPLEESDEDVRYMSRPAGSVDAKEDQVSPMLQVRWGRETRVKWDWIFIAGEMRVRCLELHRQPIQKREIMLS